VPWYESASLAASVVLCLVAVGGLLARRKVDVCRSFVPYLGAVALADLLVLVWPEQFYCQWFWFSKELVINILRFALALELTYRTFRAFPSARAAARGVLFMVLLITLIIVFAATGDLVPPEGAPALGPLITRVQPRVLNGSIWLFSVVAGLILWYRLPVHPLHKAILVSYVPYLLVFTVSLNFIESQGWGVRETVNPILGPAYLPVLGYWAIAAWRRADAPLQAPDTKPGFEEAVG
jgi:hypothetical protein